MCMILPASQQITGENNWLQAGGMGNDYRQLLRDHRHRDVRAVP
jgi:hypothetical protein